MLFAVAELLITEVRETMMKIEISTSILVSSVCLSVCVCSFVCSRSTGHLLVSFTLRFTYICLVDKLIITPLHCMQRGIGDRKAVRPSARLSVCPSNA